MMGWGHDGLRHDGSGYDVLRGVTGWGMMGWRGDGFSIGKKGLTMSQNH